MKKRLKYDQVNRIYSWKWKQRKQKSKTRRKGKKGGITRNREGKKKKQNLSINKTPKIIM